MKIICISDTHTLHKNISIPDGDTIICSGDICSYGTEKEFYNFVEWFDKLSHPNKILVAGNHDRYCEKIKIDSKLGTIHYLQDDSCVIDGIKFYGSPWQPQFCNWAFNLFPGELSKYWDLIEDDTNVLITHCPPGGILDKTDDKEDLGCFDLLDRVKQLDDLKVHVFGHIHYSYGIEIRNNKTFVNASICTEYYDPDNQPIVVDI